MAIKTLSQLIDADYSRIQFTPDLLPADVIGTMIYSQKDEKFQVKKGPVFANFVLADEINRAPAKVQSALLEAMQEKQVTIGSETFQLPNPFLVMATQNPIEQEGTYPLPEAQVDRFMLKVVIDYPSLDEEKKIIRENIAGEMPEVTPVTTADAILRARSVVREVYLDEKIEQYIADIVFATRYPVLPVPASIWPRLPVPTLSSSVVAMWCLRMCVLWLTMCSAIVSDSPTRPRPATSLARRLFQRSSIRLKYPDE